MLRMQSAFGQDGEESAFSDGESADGPDALGPSHVKEVLWRFGAALRARRKGIDQLNVYPIPDGDTGTNMSLTVQSVLSELTTAAGDDMRTIAQAVSKGAILGARGNSGAILAQALRGIAESVKEKSAIGPSDIAEALERARSSAYQSVLKPVEGTILTVVSAASEAATKSASDGHRLREQLTHVRTAAAEALARTPELLPVLKQAGVVDAGGSGFMLFLDALKSVVTGEPIPTQDEDVDDAFGVEHGNEAVDFTHVHTEISQLRYEVMFLLDAFEGSDINAFRTAWGNVGDSIVVVGDDVMWNCHIHGDDIGSMIEAALDYGRPRDIRVTDLLEQRDGIGGHGGDGAVVPETESAPAQTDIVAVANGEGIAKAYRSLGVAVVVSGGQSMNPSVGELVDALNRTSADGVLLLPNNKNIIATANHAASLCDRPVAVIPTTDMATGLSALLDYNPGLAIVENATRVIEACGYVRTAEVTRAVRDATVDGVVVKKNQWMGLIDDRVVFANDDLVSLTAMTANQILQPESEVLSIIVGKEVEESLVEEVRDRIAEAVPLVSVEVIDGGQPLYPFLLAAE